MKEAQRLRAVISNYEINKLISVSELYENQFAGNMSFCAFIKNIERLVGDGLLTRISKGVYCRPNATRYGIILPSESEILSEYIGKNRGIVVGYSMYNEMNVSTQVAKSIEVYSNTIKGFTQTIGNIKIERHNIVFSEEVASVIRMFEILKNFFSIQELNYSVFISYCNDFAKIYDEQTVCYVIEQMKYPKSAIAFMRHILQSHSVDNNLKKYLSGSSTYKYPTMERIYELAQFI